eukprot:5818553-Amphidinium_carterae.1
MRKLGRRRTHSFCTLLTLTFGKQSHSLYVCVDPCCEAQRARCPQEPEGEAPSFAARGAEAGACEFFKPRLWCDKKVPSDLAPQEEWMEGAML